MNLRLATIEDVSEIFRMAKAFHSVSPYKGIPIDDQYIIDSISHALSQPREAVIILLGLQHSKPVGLLVGAAGLCIFNGWKQAGELMFWIDPEARKGILAKEMREAYEYWAKNIAGCRLAFLSALDNEMLPAL